jgi:hypothetical protein
MALIAQRAKVTDEDGREVDLTPPEPDGEEARAGQVGRDSGEGDEDVAATSAIGASGAGVSAEEASAEEASAEEASAEEASAEEASAGAGEAP